MADGGSLGEAFVEIVAEGDGFERDLESKLNKAGSSADKASKSIGSRLTSGISGAFQKLPISGWMSSIGSKVSGAFSKVGGLVTRSLGPIGPAVSRVASGVGSAFGTVGRTVGGAFSSVGRVVGRTMSTVGSGIARTASAAKNSFVDFANKSSSSISGKLGGALSRIKDLAGTVGIIGLGAGVASLGSQAVSAASSLQKTEAALTGMYGSADQASTMIDRLKREFGDSSVAGVDAFAGVTQQLAWAGAEGDRAVGIMKNLETALTVAGGGAEQMNTVGAALGKIANEGKATAETINMISETGVPIWDMLATKIGTDVPGAMKKVSDGAVDVNDVMGALSDGGGKFFKQMSDASEASSQTMSAQFQSAKNSIITAFADMAGGVMTKLGPALANAGEAVGNWVRNIPAMLGQLKAAMDNAGVTDALSSAFNGIKSVVAGLLPLVKSFGQGIATSFGAALLVLKPVGAALQAVGGWMQRNEGFVRLLGSALAGAATAYATLKVAAMAYNAVQAILNATMRANPLGLIVTAIGLLVGAFIHLWNTSAGFREFWIGVWNAIVTAFQATVSWFSSAFAAIGSFFSGFGSTVSTVFNNVVSFIAGLPGRIGGFLTSLPGIIGNAFMAAVNWARNVVVSGFNAVVSFIGSLPGRIVAGLAALGGMLGNLFRNAWNMAKNAVTSVAGAIFGFVRTIPSRIVSGLAALGSMLWGWASAAFRRAVDGIRAGAEGIWGFVRSIPGRIVDALGNLGGLLVEAGKSIISGLLEGLKSAVSGVWDFVSGIGSKIADLKGPLPYDRRLLIPAGNAIMAGLEEGLADKWGDVRSMLKSVTREIPDVSMPVQMGPRTTAAPLAPRGSSPAGSSRQVAVNAPITVNTVVADPALVAKRTADRISMLVQA